MDNEENSSQESVVPEPRKATELLVSMEQKLDTLTKMILNQDLLLKVITDRTNKIYSYVNEIQKEYEKERISINPPPYTLSSDKEVIMTSIQDVLPLSETPAITKRTNNVIEDKSFKPEESFSNSDKKIPIIQRITDQNGKDLFMAEVVLSDNNKKLLGKFKTNAAGKWQAHLKPGKYFVKVSKTNTVDKTLLEMDQEINIPSNMTGTFILPLAMMRR